ncbi:hypothetical protein FB451DRAFT_1411617 [Mycena latifolia]|nr:hypothetical protein FB451DRAFT_1411617 [Mycena latifolia]
MRVLTFTFVTLTIVRAALSMEVPLEAPPVCSLDPVMALDTTAFNTTQLRNRKNGEAIFVSNTHDKNPFDQWIVERTPRGSAEYRIINVGLSTGTSVGSEGRVVSGYHGCPNTFTIVTAGKGKFINTFIISEPFKDSVWTAESIRYEIQREIKIP